MSATRRSGYVMVTVLWMIAATAVVALAAALSGRRAFDAVRNRVGAERAYWRAHDCAARGRAAVDEALAGADDPLEGARAWRRLGASVRSTLAAGADHCVLRMTAAGSYLDLNTADAATLVRLFARLGYEGEAASLSDALLDWRDEDHDERPLGAEGPWYAGAGRAPPLNRALAGLQELRRVRGFEEMEGLDTVLSAEPGRLFLGEASLPALGAVSGFTPELVQRIADARAAGEDIPTLLSITSDLSVATRDSLIAHFPEITKLTSPDPDAWILTAIGRDASGRSEASIELRLLRAGATVQVARRKVIW